MDVVVAVVAADEVVAAEAADRVRAAVADDDVARGGAEEEVVGRRPRADVGIRFLLRMSVLLRKMSSFSLRGGPVGPLRVLERTGPPAAHSSPRLGSGENPGAMSSGRPAGLRTNVPWSRGHRSP
jgi:hypothetical protein